MPRIISTSAACLLLLGSAACAPITMNPNPSQPVVAAMGNGRSYDCPGGTVSNQEASELNGNMACANPTLAPGQREF